MDPLDIGGALPNGPSLDALGRDWRALLRGVLMLVCAFGIGYVIARLSSAPTVVAAVETVVDAAAATAENVVTLADKSEVIAAT